MNRPIVRHGEAKRTETLDFLAACGGNVRAAASGCGIPERTVRSWARSAARARAKAAAANPPPANPLAADIRAAAGRTLARAIARLDDPADNTPARGLIAAAAELHELAEVVDRVPQPAEPEASDLSRLSVDELQTLHAIMLKASGRPPRDY